MLTIYKGSKRISVYPDNMRHILASMNIIKALEQQRTQPQPPTQAAEPARKLQETDE